MFALLAIAILALCIGLNVVASNLMNSTYEPEPANGFTGNVENVSIQRK